MDVFSTELGIRLSFVNISEFGGGGRGLNPQPPGYAAVPSCKLVPLPSRATNRDNLTVTVHHRPLSNITL
jgi:hypothetical protein